MDIRFDGVVLKYHYLTEFVAAAISSYTGISCYDIMGFYMQGLMLVFFLTAMYDFGNIYYNCHEGKTNLFTLSFFALSCLSLWKVLPNGAIHTNCISIKAGIASLYNVGFVFINRLR